MKDWFLKKSKQQYTVVVVVVGVVGVGVVVVVRQQISAQVSSKMHKSDPALLF